MLYYFRNKTILAGSLMAAGLLALAPLGAGAENGLPQSVILNVPFTTQAPLGEWRDPRQADGCEEASLVMTMMWARGGSVPAEEARRDIIEMSEYEKVFYGFFEDTSAQDTARLLTDYYHYTQVRVQENITIADIKAQLAQGNLVMVPVNARKLSRSYSQGPVRHTVVVTGYDDQTGQIIVNDPLLNHGHNLRFQQLAFSNALSNYASGKHKSPLNPRQTAMIVVNKTPALP